MRRILTATLLCSASAFAAGPFLIGVRGGAPLNDVIRSVSSGAGVSAATKNYLVGPTVGLKLPLGFSVTGDALFTRLTIDVRAAAASASAHANSWEFPVMLRFTAGSQWLAPVLGAGFSVRHLSDFGNIGDFITGSPNSPAVVGKSNTVGFVLGGGLRFKAGPLSITPELRYTHWGANNISSAFHQVLRTNENEGQILLGLTL